MKGKICLLLTVVMLVTAFIPGYIFAASEPGLEEAIKKVKETFRVPDDFKEFNYAITNFENENVWNLNWRSKDGNGVVEAVVDSKGNVMEYYIHDYTQNNSKKLAKISKNDAKIIADNLLKKVDNEIYDQLKFIDEQYINSEEVYYFGYVRTYKGVEFPSNGVTVAIDRQSGELQSYRKNWLLDASFPSPEKIITLQDAEKTYSQKLGLTLIYQAVYEKEGYRIYPVYVPEYSATSVIDAITGEVMAMDNDLRVQNTSFGYLKKSIFDLYKDESVVLTPEEVSAVEEVSNLLNIKEVEKIARGIKILELDEGFKIEYSQLNRDWQNKNKYLWNLSFRKEPSENMNDYRYVDISIDAKTGEIRSFNSNYTRNEKEKAKYDKKSAKETVEKFLNEIQPQKFKETEYQNEDVMWEKYVPEEQLNYNFSYVRKVNGILFPQDLLYVTYDAVTGKIVNYSMNWTDGKFPSIENVLSKEKVEEKFYKEIGLKLNYQLSNNDYEITLKLKGKKSSDNIKLVYSVNTVKPSNFDANTGEILDNQGKPYKEQKPVQYKDIKGHFAENQIKVLAESGIALEGDEFKPNTKIKQKDFMLLISQVLGNGYEFFGKTSVNDNEKDNLYKLMIREGIIKESEVAPDENLTREDSVKFVIRALKYEKVAQLDVFNCTFKDKEHISEGLVGFVVIAKGLKIINGFGEYFRPKDELTRAEGAVIIYNYLQVE